MKANGLNVKDLMLGDWVRYIYKPRHDELEWNGRMIPQMFRHPADFHLFPIPLTVEILEKNGWKSLMNGSGDFILTKPLVGNSATVTKTINGFELRNGVFNGLGILFVHELQHAMRLCGIEKSIEL